MPSARGVMHVVTDVQLRAHRVLRALAQLASVDTMSAMKEQNATRALTRKHLQTIKLEREDLDCRRVGQKK